MVLVVLVICTLVVNRMQFCKKFGIFVLSNFSWEFIKDFFIIKQGKYSLNIIHSTSKGTFVVEAHTYILSLHV